MGDVGRMMIAVGLLTVVVGGVVLAMSWIGFRGMPGDIRLEGAHFRVYFPIVTCLLLSALLTLGSMLWRWWAGR